MNTKKPAVIAMSATLKIPERNHGPIPTFIKSVTSPCCRNAIDQIADPPGQDQRPGGEINPRHVPASKEDNGDDCKKGAVGDRQRPEPVLGRQSPPHAKKRARVLDVLARSRTVSPRNDCRPTGASTRVAMRFVAWSHPIPVTSTMSSIPSRARRFAFMC